MCPKARKALHSTHSLEEAVIEYITALKNGNYEARLKINDSSENHESLNSCLIGLAKQLQIQAEAQAIFHQSADAIMTLAPPSWKFTSCNKAALALFEVRNEKEFIKIGPWNVSPEKQPDGSLSSNSAPEMILKAMKEGSHFFDWEHQTLSGKNVPCTVLLSRVDTGDSSYLQATVRDVSAEKKLLRNLKEQELEISTVLETMADGLVIQNENGSIEKFNEAALTLLGLTGDQLRGRTSLDQKWKAIKEDGTLFPGEEHPAMVALKTGKPIQGVRMGLKLPSDKERWIKINAVPFEGINGRRVACTFSDITALIESNSEIKHIFSHSMDLMCIAHYGWNFKKSQSEF